jgi:hypothetical protein
MSRRLPPHRSRQALKAGLPVKRRAPRPEPADFPAEVWLATYDLEGTCLSRDRLTSPAAHVLLSFDAFGRCTRVRDLRAPGGRPAAADAPAAAAAPAPEDEPPA